MAELRLPDNFVDVAKIGAGGMGTVYKAFDKTLDRTVALKVLSQTNYDQALLKRFQVEAKALSKLNHPHIVKAHSFGVLPDGYPYMTLEYVEGKSLQQIIQDEGFIAVPRAVPLFIQIGEALSCAHDAGLIHRDIKPSNVCVTLDESAAECCKLLDFGIARDTSTAQKLTATGAMLGSLPYISPEQAGSSTPPDQRSDIYSFGCLMYETLTGQLPFPGDDPFQLLNMHIAAEPQPLTEVRAEIPEGLDRIVRRCLLKDPEKRFQTASQLVAALKKGDTAFQAPNQAARFKLSRNAVFLACIALATVVFTMLAMLPRNNERREQESMDQRRKVVQLVTSARAIDTDMTVKNRLAKAEVLYSEALQLAQSLDKLPEDPQLAQIYHKLGSVQMREEKNPQAMMNLQKAVEVLPGGFQHTVLFSDIQSDLGEVYRVTKKYDQALVCLNLALHTERKPRWPSTKMKIGEIYEQKREYERAADYLRQSLALYANTMGLDNEVANTRCHLANTYIKLKQYDNALEQFRLAKQIDDELHTPAGAVAGALVEKNIQSLLLNHGSQLTHK